MEEERPISPKTELEVGLQNAFIANAIFNDAQPLIEERNKLNDFILKHQTMGPSILWRLVELTKSKQEIVPLEEEIAEKSRLFIHYVDNAAHFIGRDVIGSEVLFSDQA